MASFSLTKALVASDPEAFQQATQSPFLSLAARGQMNSTLLGKWLANDRLYIHSYIRGIGRMLSDLSLPPNVPASADEPDTPSVKLLDWLVGAMVNIRREEKFFVDAARSYGINVNLETGSDGRVQQEAKLEGLRRFEGLFNSITLKQDDVIPWLEGVVVFWGTEKCYLDAWTWARGQLDEKRDASEDADGGALRKEFIPNWTSKEFVEFVDDLGAILDEAVNEAIKIHGESIKEQLLERSVRKWKALLAAEQAFWPEVKD